MTCKAADNQKHKKTDIKKNANIKETLENDIKTCWHSKSFENDIKKHADIKNSRKCHQQMLTLNKHLKMTLTNVDIKETLEQMTLKHADIKNTFENMRLKSADIKTWH